MIVGAGIAGCALAARLRQLGWRGAITLVEAGRGLGGRAASRPSRRDPDWRLDHGAPLLQLSGDAAAPQLLEPLLRSGRLRSCRPEQLQLAVLESDGSLQARPGPFADSGRLYRGWPAMADLAGGMLELADAAAAPGGPAEGASPLHRCHGIRVEALEPWPGGWRLRDGNGDVVALGPWLVLSGTLLAHPRCRTLLGCAEVPLAAANRVLGDAALEQALQALAHLRYDPRLALLLRLEAAEAEAWRALPGRHLSLSATMQQRSGLERIVVQPLADGRCAVVAHARPDDLAAASQAAGNRDAASEAEEIARLSQALLLALQGWIQEQDLPPIERRQRMRWGGAFPLAPGLDPETMVCRNSRLALCGDAIAGPGFGRVEGAWRSGEWLAERLLPEL